jgi:RNA recognition motif-containing protein
MLKQMVSGAILSIDNMPKAVTVDEVRTFFGQYGDVKWVDCDEVDNSIQVC